MSTSHRKEGKPKQIKNKKSGESEEEGLGQGGKKISKKRLRLQKNDNNRKKKKKKKSNPEKRTWLVQRLGLQKIVIIII